MSWGVYRKIRVRTSNGSFKSDVGILSFHKDTRFRDAKYHRYDELRDDKEQTIVNKPIGISIKPLLMLKLGRSFKLESTISVKSY
ncbi:hypothetical protein MKX03_029491 [Papaver bracteatum]|nr:hypothetical protein MKX03_029491 [Papaver bracteatum]